MVTLFGLYTLNLNACHSSSQTCLGSSLSVHLWRSLPMTSGNSLVTLERTIQRERVAYCLQSPEHTWGTTAMPWGPALHHGLYTGCFIQVLGTCLPGIAQAQCMGCILQDHSTGQGHTLPPPHCPGLFSPQDSVPYLADVGDGGCAQFSSTPGCVFFSLWRMSLCGTVLVTTSVPGSGFIWYLSNEM